jgi:hypothetical protein
MSNLFKVSLAFVVAALVSACAQQEEPAPAPVVVTPDPVYSKF